MKLNISTSPSTNLNSDVDFYYYRFSLEGTTDNLNRHRPGPIIDRTTRVAVLGPYHTYYHAQLHYYAVIDSLAKPGFFSSGMTPPASNAPIISHHLGGKHCPS